MMRVLFEKRIYANVDGLRNVIRLLGRTSEPIRKLKAEDISMIAWCGSWRRRDCPPPSEAWKSNDGVMDGWVTEPILQYSRIPALQSGDLDASRLLVVDLPM